MTNQKIHYLDNSATTRPCRESAEEVMYCLDEVYGNPSSLHAKGTQAMQKLEKSREIIADSIKCNPDCITFTSGATESTSMALIGAAEKYGRKRRKIITTSVEHASVRETFRFLETKGFEAVYIARRNNC